GRGGGRGAAQGIRARKGQVTPRTRGAFTSCTATYTNGAATGTTRSCPAASIPTCTTPRQRRCRIGTAVFRGCAVVAAGPTKAGRAGRPSACASSRNDGRIILGFGWWGLDRDEEC